MSSNRAIEVVNISKRYKRGTPTSNLREYLYNLFKPRQLKAEEFLALNKINFLVRPGERVGIIGKNGAGKSTLLKILSRITEPTEGYATIYGRVGSLLEVGAGFHPELTGYENIFLNGAILGMSRSEIYKKLSAIIDFSEIESFLHTPVKHYSSGMYTRLAFSVAAHLESEILLIDEALSVGDTAFQQKCLSAMQGISQEGRTILFVSHDISALSKLCDRILWLHNGNLKADGPSEEVILEYLNNRELEEISNAWRATRQLALPTASKPIAITDLNLTTTTGQEIGELYTGDGIQITLGYRSIKKLSRINFSVQLRSRLGTEIIRLNTTPISGYPVTEPAARGHLDLIISSLPLTAGIYTLDVGVGFEGSEWVDLQEKIIELKISPCDVYGSGMSLDNTRGLLIVEHQWHHRPSVTS